MNKPAMLIVSVDTYNAIITNRSPIVDHLKDKDLYYGLQIRSVENIDNNYVETFDINGKFIEKLKLYDI